MNQFSPSSFLIINYLPFMYETRKLSAVLVIVHRAAVSTTLRQMGKFSFSEDSLLRDVTRSLILL